jgi:hypothetical protein
MPSLTLSLLPETFAVCRLAPDVPLPDWAAGEFVSITRTSDELSIVCAERNVPPSVRCERGWRCLKVAGPLDLSLIGILASLAVPLAEARIPLFAISTYDTDYVLVKEADLERAVETLLQAGHTMQLA